MNNYRLKTLILAFLFVWTIIPINHSNAATPQPPAYFSRAQTQPNMALVKAPSAGFIKSITTRYAVIFNIIKILLVIYFSYKVLKILGQRTGMG
jgi:hypothetical protein